MVVRLHVMSELPHKQNDNVLYCRQERQYSQIDLAERMLVLERTRPKNELAALRARPVASVAGSRVPLRLRDNRRQRRPAAARLCGSCSSLLREN
jgi:hypothetical protein